MWPERLCSRPLIVATGLAAHVVVALTWSFVTVPPVWICVSAWAGCQQQVSRTVKQLPGPRAVTFYGCELRCCRRIIGPVDLTPDVDYSCMLSGLPPRDRMEPAALGEWLSRAWAESYRSRVGTSEILTFEHAATFLFDHAQAAGAPQDDRSITAWGLSRPGRRPRPTSGGTRLRGEGRTGRSTRDTGCRTAPEGSSGRTSSP